MTLSPQRLDKAAEAMAAKRAELQHLPLARIYDDLARAAISAYLGDDMVVVPREPTAEIINEIERTLYDRVVNGDDYSLVSNGPELLYKAALSAELTERDAG